MLKISIEAPPTLELVLQPHFCSRCSYVKVTVPVYARVAELGSLSSGAKMAMKTFVKRVFTIFVSNALFLRVIAKLQNNSVKYAIYTM